MTNIKIRNMHGNKYLFLDKKFEASWANTVDDFETIIPYALEVAYIKGKEAKAKQIKLAIGL